ncbi:MAG: META domain-containing protein [Ginsengibacter sp.]|jgi:heat shock protein HslJ
MKYALIFILTAFTFIACNPTKHSAELIGMNSQLNNSVWQLIQLNNAPITTTYEKKPYLEFLDSNKVSGFLGCNIMGGNYGLSKSSGIYFADTWSTKMSCEALDLETLFSSALSKVTNYKISHDTLFLQDKEKIPLATFLSRADLEQVK